MNPPRSATLFCSTFFFPLPHLSLSIVLLLVTHLLVSFLIPTFARNYPPRNLLFLTHVTTSRSSFFFSPSRYFFSLCYSSLSPVLCFTSCLFTHHQHLFFHGNQRSFFPSTFNNHSQRHLFSFRDLILHLAFLSLNSFFPFNL
ncbi:hypothetical protein BKA57DRAFT_228972 [Linnemannia elongata]|nr:hypothetical protein BKA57DRAFT_228972 [Linnemannia elongata]